MVTMKKILSALIFSAASFASSGFQNNTLGLQCADGQSPGWANGYFSTCATGGGGGGAGTVTSVGLTSPAWLTVTGSPVTASGTLALTPTAGQTANQFLSTPNGSTGAISLRAIASADLPASLALTGTPTVPTAAPGTNTTQAASTAFVAAGLSGKISTGGVALTDLATCSANQIIQMNSGGTLWACAAAPGGGGATITGTPTVGTIAYFDSTSSIKSIAVPINIPTTGSLYLGTTNASLSGTNNICIGDSSCTSATTGANNVAVGQGALIAGGYEKSVVIGQGASGVTWSVTIGNGASTTGSGTAIAVGRASTAGYTGVTVGDGASSASGIALGYRTGSTANGINIGGQYPSLAQTDNITIGSPGTSMAHVWIGHGNDAYGSPASAVAGSVTFHGPEVSSSAGSNQDVSASSMIFAAPRSTGTAHGGTIKWQYGQAGSSGSTLNTLADGLVMDSATGVISAPQGFIPAKMTTTQKSAISSPPEGLMVYDVTLHKLCVYTGSAWETITSM